MRAHRDSEGTTTCRFRERAPTKRACCGDQLIEASGGGWGRGGKGAGEGAGHTCCAAAAARQSKFRAALVRSAAAVGHLWERGTGAAGEQGGEDVVVLSRRRSAKVGGHSGYTRSRLFERGNTGPSDGMQGAVA